MDRLHWHGSLKAYLRGFVAALLLTCISFLMVLGGFERRVTLYALIGLAVLQAFVQLIFFLHVGQEAKPRWETLTFAFMILILLIVALGSFWIIHDLNIRVMGHD